MAGNTTIEWSEKTWNPLRGCTVFTAECTNCYAMRYAHRFSGEGKPFEGLTMATKGGPVWTGKIRLVPKDLETPLGWKRPTRIFVNSMSDLFHDDVPEEYILKVFEVMERAAWHTFQLLTKRAKRLHELAPRLPWPKNVWAGVSIGYDKSAYKARLLAETPARVKWVSAEPLIGPVPSLNLEGVDWVAIGGESGPRSRPMNLDWAREVIARARESGTRVFVKQLGSVWGKGKGDYKGHDMELWAADLRIREYPEDWE